jgi:glycosyltransferase involved in cell wall biosynthesis
MSIESPKVLVYVPVHNGLLYIRECLDSILTQTYPNQEVVVCDNGSDDGTREIIEIEYLPKYPQLKLSKLDQYNELNNPGLLMTLSNSDCEFYTTCGADDKLVQGFWEKTLPYFSNPDVGVVRIACYQFSETNPEGAIWLPPAIWSPLEILYNNKIFITSPARKAAWDEIQTSPWGGCDLNCFFSDWDMWIQMLLLGWKWADCLEPLFWYRRRPNTWSQSPAANFESSAYSYMRKKWMPTLLKYNIPETTMATKEQLQAAKKEQAVKKELEKKK